MGYGWYEFGYPQRVLVSKDPQEILAWINKWNGIRNLYRSVYSFSSLKDSRPIYQSAVIDKLFFDFDPPKGKEKDVYEEVKKFSSFLKDRNIKHYVRFSGRGWHVFVLTDIVTDDTINKKVVILNAQRELVENGGIDKELVDTSVFGDISRIARIPGTLNLKTKRYCENWDIEKNIPVKKKKIIGENFYPLEITNEVKHYDYEEEKEHSWEELKGRLNPQLDMYPPCISHILMKGEGNWQERFLVVTYFKERGYSPKDVENLLRKYLTKVREHHNGRICSDAEHAIEDERIIDKIFNRYDYIFPSCAWIKAHGLCPVKGYCGKKVYR